MSVQEGNDFDQARLGKYLVGVYYYALGLDEVMSDDSAVIGFCDTIQTVTFNPFIDFEELDLIKCNFDSDKYEINGYDVIENIHIDWYDALLGRDVVIDHPTGKRIKVKIPEYCKHGNLLKLSKQGILGVGNYYIRILHKYPNKLSKEVKKKLEEIKESCK